MDADNHEHNTVNPSSHTVENKPRRFDAIKPITRSHITTVDRDVVVQDLNSLFVLWVQKNAIERKGMNRMSKEPHRFRRACDNLWKFNREFYESLSIVEQIRNQVPLGKRKRDWLFDLFAQSKERLDDLQQLTHFLEALVENLWEDIPSSEAENATGQALYWAQDAAIATGPHLVHRLYRMDDRPIRRRDFTIGNVYLQGHTIQSLIEEIKTAEEK